MILEILLLIVGIYLSIMFTLFFLFVTKELKQDKSEMLKDYERRTILFNKILHLCYKIDSKTHLNKKNYKYIDDMYTFMVEQVGFTRKKK